MTLACLAEPKEALTFYVFVFSTFQMELLNENFANLNKLQRVCLSYFLDTRSNKVVQFKCIHYTFHFKNNNNNNNNNNNHFIFGQLEPCSTKVFIKNKHKSDPDLV